MSDNAGRGARFGTAAQERLLVEYADEVLAKVFQGKRPELHEHLIGLAAKMSRQHQWPYFEECVQSEVERRLAGHEPRGWYEAATATPATGQDTDR